MNTKKATYKKVIARKKTNFTSKVNDQSWLLVCMFDTRCSLQSQSSINNAPRHNNTNHGNLPLSVQT